MKDNSDKSLINYDRMERLVRCINPSHEPIEFLSRQTEQKCPLCENLMVRVVKPLIDPSDKE